jgi:hypothetical protein
VVTHICVSTLRATQKNIWLENFYYPDVHLFLSDNRLKKKSSFITYHLHRVSGFSALKSLRYAENAG